MERKLKRQSPPPPRATGSSLALLCLCRLRFLCDPGWVAGAHSWRMPVAPGALASSARPRPSHLVRIRTHSPIQLGLASICWGEGCPYTATSCGANASLWSREPFAIRPGYGWAPGAIGRSRR